MKGRITLDDSWESSSHFPVNHYVLAYVNAVAFAFLALVVELMRRIARLLIEFFEAHMMVIATRSHHRQMLRSHLQSNVKEVNESVSDESTYLVLRESLCQKECSMITV